MPDIATLDARTLETWFAANLAGFSGPLTARKFPHGQSNPTYQLHTPHADYVLRRKPPGLLLKSAHAIEREFRVMSALGKTGVPVPKTYALCEDENVIGSAFFVMGYVPGRHFEDPRLPDLDNEARGAVYDDINRVLAALHSVDVAAVGLSDFGRPGNYFARQVKRWSEQYRASETDAVPDMDALIAWLPGATPADDGRVSIVHGDYRIDNMIFSPSSPRIDALIDWELSTLGHPLADLSHQCMQWRLPVGPVGRGLGGVDRAAIGIPDEEDYLARYAARTGLAHLDDWPFALAFAFFRFAAILQGVKKRALDGNASNPEFGLALAEMIPLLAAEGAAIAASGRT
ncbi:MAG: phosphotransferase family protein [Hyphomicrobiales bacterium]